MEYHFNIIKIGVTMDMGIGNRTRRWTYISCDNLEVGDEYDINKRQLNVISVDESEVVFTFMGKRYTMNRDWQVLGTPEIGIPNEYISESERFIFFFSCDSDSTHSWDDSEITELINQMMANRDEGKLWKNIPLARRLLHILKDEAPFRADSINPAHKAHLISFVLKNDLIEKTEAPRLFQSLCEYYRLCIDFGLDEDYDEELKKVFDKQYFRTVDSWIYKFAWIVDNPTREYAIECWNGLGKMLKSDPVQATPEWEEVIYDVEKEVDEDLKEEPRGMGFCFAYWSAKRAALERRGIEWRTPSQMNPGVMFD